MPKKTRSKTRTKALLANTRHFQSPAILAAVTITSLVGVYIVARLLAAGLTSFQAEGGNLTGTIAVKADSSASGGQYIQFGTTNGTNPPPPVTPPPPPVAPPPPPPTGGNGVGGSGADMTPGRKCAAGTSGATTISGGDLNSAVNSLPSGGTLVVNAGNYSPFSVSNRSNLTICGAPGSRPRINAGGGTAITINGSSSNIHIEGFEVYGSATGGTESGIRIQGDAHHIHIWDNWAHDFGSVGIGASNGYCGHIDWRYNRVWNTAYYDGYHSSGIATYEPRNCGNNTPDTGIYTDFIIGNVVFANGEKIGGATDGNCIIWDDTLDQQGGNQTEGPYNGRVLVANNLCVANGGRGVHIGPTSARADVVNNTDYHNFNLAFTVPDANDGYVGDMDAGYMSQDVRFINNVSIARSGKNGFDYGDSSGVVKSNNIFNRVTRDNGTGGYQLMEDPGFTNATEDSNTWNFRPRSGSPMINAGVGSYSNIIIPNVDITGRARSSSPSIGAYEP